MPSDTLTPNPSQTVERIREIIVGRHLDRLERRVALLEEVPAGSPQSDARLGSIEAHVEALQQRYMRLSDSVRVEAETRETRHVEETRRLTEHIQRTIAAQIVPDRTAQLEAKLGQWLVDWQTSSRQQGEVREQQLITHLREELSQLREWVSEKLARQPLDSERADMKRRFALIAQAARVLAEAAETGPLPGTLPPLP